MKTLLGIVLISVLCVFGGCNQTPAPQQPTPAVQGPAGPPGQTGEQGQPGQEGQVGQTGDTGQTGDRGHTGDTGHRGDTGYRGDTGHTGQTGDQGRDAPCPAGQHRHTNPDTGKVICVSD